jgi:hypothetical protein
MLASGFHRQAVCVSEPSDWLSNDHSALTRASGACRGREFSLSYTRTYMEHGIRKESPMITLDSTLITALATFVTGLAGLVWAFRRKQ